MKRSKVIGLSVAFVLLAAVIGGGYWYYTNTQNHADEEAAYACLEGNESPADYEAYLEAWPEGPRADEVRERLEALQTMLTQWRSILVGGRQRDFELFRQNYPQSTLAHQCDLKIDSLDWSDASLAATPEAVERYLKLHPEGRFVSEASIMQSQLADATASPEEQFLAEQAIASFFRAFGAGDAENVFTHITPTMSRFLSKTNATKADVADIMERTRGEHIQSCHFVMGDDYTVNKVRSAEGEWQYNVSFSVDQHIQRDNEGKTFGSYTAEAIVTSQFKLTSLTMHEVSRR